MADPTDVQKILDQAPADKIVFTSYLETYAHLDFTWAYNAKDVLYPDVAKVLTQYASTKSVGK
jgi:hypothetical protein